jgi:hypothetical protein
LIPTSNIQHPAPKAPFVKHKTAIILSHGGLIEKKHVYLQLENGVFKTMNIEKIIRME